MQYQGNAQRSVRPEAVTCTVSSQTEELPTSEKIAEALTRCILLVHLLLERLVHRVGLAAV